MSRSVLLQMAALGQTGGAGTPPTRVVIVDDTEDLRFILRRLLANTGRFQVDGEGADGREAVALAQRLQPDVMLLDLLMPVMDGWTALPQIRKVSPRTRVIVVSGQDRTQAEPRALALGAAGYVEKGASSTELVHQIESLIDSARQGA